MTKTRLYSGMQPSADSLQIGNYIGALMQWRDLQESYDAFFSVVDLHALTQPNDPSELREKTRRTAAQYIAAGCGIVAVLIFLRLVDFSALRVDLGMVIGDFLPIPLAYVMLGALAVVISVAAYFVLFDD